MTFNGFEFNKLDFLVSNITHPTDGIPIAYGIYSWVYWPKFDETTITQNDLKDLLIDYSSQDFYIEEKLKGIYKFEGQIWEQGYNQNGNMFGLNTSKHNSLYTYFSIRANIINFKDFFQDFCFAKPFYIGKANNLRSRLSSNFNGKTNVIPQINTKGIPYKDIWVGYKTVTGTVSKDMNVIFEEIYSRKVKPGLTIKPN